MAANHEALEESGEIQGPRELPTAQETQPERIVAHETDQRNPENRFRPRRTRDVVPRSSLPIAAVGVAEHEKTPGVAHWYHDQSPTAGGSGTGMVTGYRAAPGNEHARGKAVRPLILADLQAACDREYDTAAVIFPYVVAVRNDDGSEGGVAYRANQSSLLPDAVGVVGVWQGCLALDCDLPGHAKRPYAMDSAEAHAEFARVRTMLDEHELLREFCLMMTRGGWRLWVQLDRPIYAHCGQEGDDRWDVVIGDRLRGLAALVRTVTERELVADELTPGQGMRPPHVTRDGVMQRWPRDARIGTVRYEDVPVIACPKRQAMEKQRIEWQNKKRTRQGEQRFDERSRSEIGRWCAQRWLDKQSNVGQGSRDKEAIRVAYVLLQGCELDDDEAWRLLCEWDSGNAPPLGERHCREKIRSAGRTTAANRGWMIESYLHWQAEKRRKVGLPREASKRRVIERGPDDDPAETVTAAELGEASRRMIPPAPSIDELDTAAQWHMDHWAEQPALEPAAEMLGTLVEPVVRTVEQASNVPEHLEDARRKLIRSLGLDLGASQLVNQEKLTGRKIFMPRHSNHWCSPVGAANSTRAWLTRWEGGRFEHGDEFGRAGNDGDVLPYTVAQGWWSGATIHEAAAAAKEGWAAVDRSGVACWHRILRIHDPVRDDEGRWWVAVSWFVYTGPIDGALQCDTPNEVELVYRLADAGATEGPTRRMWGCRLNSREFDTLIQHYSRPGAWLVDPELVVSVLHMSGLRWRQSSPGWNKLMAPKPPARYDVIAQVCDLERIEQAEPAAAVRGLRAALDHHDTARRCPSRLPHEFCSLERSDHRGPQVTAWYTRAAAVLLLEEMIRRRDAGVKRRAGPVPGWRELRGSPPYGWGEPPGTALAAAVAAQERAGGQTGAPPGGAIAALDVQLIGAGW